MAAITGALSHWTTALSGILEPDLLIQLNFRCGQMSWLIRPPMRQTCSHWHGQTDDGSYTILFSYVKRQSSVVVLYGHRTNNHGWWDRGRYSEWGIRMDGLSRKNGASPHVGQHIFLISTACRMVLGPTQPTIQCAPWILSRAIKHVKVRVITDIPKQHKGKAEI